MSLTKVERHALYDCLRKKVRTQSEAETEADGETLWAYPCPFSQIEWHWHLTSDWPSAKPQFYVAREKRAIEAGGLGYPPDWAITTIRAARVAEKARRQKAT